MSDPISKTTITYGGYRPAEDIARDLACRTAPRTIDDVLKDHRVIQSGRTRYPGQQPRDDELMAAEIERLRALLQAGATP